MAEAYLAVLLDLGTDVVVVGRSMKSCSAFERTTGTTPLGGGIHSNLHSAAGASHAIMAVGVEDLAATASAVIHAGVPNVLLEKPGAMYLDELKGISSVAARASASVHVGYNRRFFASTLAAKELIAADGGAQTVHCDFTEMESRVLASDRSAEVLARLFLVNSTHVVDMALSLSGEIDELHTQQAGSLPWHEAGAQFVGFGTARSGTLFSYKADWSSAGRWGVEVTTPLRRLILRPLEQLFEQLPGSFDITQVELADDLDRQFKPGLHLQVRNFLFEQGSGMLTVSEQAKRWHEVYARMVSEPTG